ncbi:lysylphosphatidylglycerol synthase transmembrane domain-containing protein [Maribacter sp. 1_MG-2023]|uniref:lysylphosphatidylglycerol synthase transmembrane domain-containing protein n=1 Tax=Maribacter sp. 1_MG-2023 TaxID=3062677 RepID=UPI0026E3A181|nr:lysylphosphatidylglycerol synthase transmembrane domain-containing protein [Maribacter sp. 1_MG-2023]MDO6470582.1 lysylphosphatidylglycerol synthase transmembrane domain-containing protein [Maribacter sp. 1_MG-2023]
MAKLNKKVTTGLKVLISAVLIYFIFTKINVSEIKDILMKSNPLYLVLAAIFFILSKFIGAIRLNLYFHRLNIMLTNASNFKLYLLGMFYNLFLPGGIGGDAYKGYILKKTFDVKTKKMVSVLVLDRLGGLLLLFIYACGLLAFHNAEILDGYRWILLSAIPISVIVFWLLNKKFFNYVLTIFWKTTALSALVQLAQLICIWFILLALNIEMNQISYLIIFLISSIVAVVPLTLGGIGSREVTFFYGAKLLGLDQNISVGVSVLFFLITAIVSFIGVWYHFKKIKLELAHTSNQSANE